MDIEITDVISRGFIDCDHIVRIRAIFGSKKDF